jgi:hypothetical protein
LSVRATLVLSLVAVACAGGGCAARTPTRPALISHVVFVTLSDPTLADAVIADCDRQLATIPGVVSYAAGPHLDTGRDNVDGNYDVGLYIGFDSREAYARYVDHPQHLALLAKWKSAVTSLRIHDVVDESE